MSLSGDGARVLRALEGEKLASYRDAKNVLTIGVGHTGAIPAEIQSRYALPPVVVSDMMITEEASEALLAFDIAWAEAAVRKLVTAPLTQAQFDALVIFTFWAGEPNFATSTLLKMLNSGNLPEAADEFPKWRKSGGRVLGALEKRRAVERHIFLTGHYDETPYDGDLSDAYVPVKERAPVDRPATEGSADLRKSRTMDASRQLSFAAILAMLAQVKQTFGEGVFAAIPSWAWSAFTMAALAFIGWQVARVVLARMDDHLKRGR